MDVISIGQYVAIVEFSRDDLDMLARSIAPETFMPEKGDDPRYDVALAMDPKEEGLLTEKFKRPSKYIVDWHMVIRMVVMSVPMMIGTLLLFKGALDGGSSMTKALTISLTTLAVFQWFNVWNCRSDHKSIFQQNPFSNKWLIYATVVVIALQMLVVYNPVMQKIFHTTALTSGEWWIITMMALSIIAAEEIRKLVYRLAHIAKQKV